MMLAAPPFTIQRANWRDLVALKRLENVCFGADSWPVIDLVTVLTLPGVVRLKAVEENSMAGFVGGDPRPREDLGWITTIGVLPRYRRQGIATALLDHCEEQMAMGRIRLCVRRSNQGAIQLYLDRGYRQVSVWANYYSGGEDALVLEKIR